MRNTLQKLKEKKYLTSILLVVLVVFVIGLISILKPVVKNIKIEKVLTKTSSLNASVIDGVSEGVISNNYDEIKYQIKVNKDAEDTAVIIATLSDEELKYARFKEIKNSEVSENGKKITITTKEEKINIIVVVENAPYGSTVNPKIEINSEDENKKKINVDPVTITGKSVEGRISSEDGILYKGLELSLVKNSEEVKRTYTKDNGEYVFSLGDVDDYKVELAEEKYKIVRYEDETTDENRKILNIVVKEVEPFKVNIKKTISKLDLVINSKKETYTYDDVEKVVRSMKNAKTIEGSVYYNIYIKNEGEVKGTLTVLKDKIPEGLSFDASKNPGWTKNGKYLFYTPLEGKEIESFGKKSVTLVLDIVKTNEAKTYINEATANGDDYKYVVYYLNNSIFKEEYVINSEKLENIDPGVENFDGWYTDKNYTNRYDFNSSVTKDTALFGKIKNNKYTVTFIDVNPNNGAQSILDVKEVEDGTPVELVSHPEYQGYTFKCFKINDTCYNGEDITSDSSLVTSYTMNNYNIVYDLDGGTVSTANPSTYTVKDEITLNNPTKEGYTFIGWSGTDLSEDTLIVTIPLGSIGDREYVANYEKNTSSLTVNPNGGIYEGVSTNTVYVEDYGTVKTINDSEKTGYNFIGYTHTGGGTFVNKVFTFDNDDAELTANYEIINYTIEYNNITEEERTALSNPISYNIETETFTLNEPSTRVDEGNPSEDFLGWDDGNGNVSKNVSITKGSTGNKSYTAVWRENQDEYAITYNLNGGTLENTNPSTYTRQSNDITLNNPSKDGYNFLGWTGSNGNVPKQIITIPKGSAGDRHYVANYELISYTITYNGLTDAEIALLGNPDSYTIETNTFNLTNPSKNGYNFLGWTGSNGDTPADVTIAKGSTGNKEYTANFEVIEYNIVLNLNGGTVSTPNPTKYTIESNQITLNNPSKDGYNFTGWTGSNGDVPQTAVTIPAGSIEEKTYTANYEPIVYNITYDYNGGSLDDGVTNPSTYTIESEEITFNNPSKEGYTFANYTINDVITTSIPTGSTGDKHLVANYEKRKYNVKYYNGEDQYSSEQVEWHDVATAPPVNPSKAHNIFLYWSEDGTTEYDFDTLISSDKNLYAVYEEVVAPSITLSPTLNETTNRTWVCGNSNDSNCGVTLTLSSDHNDYELYYKIGDEEPQLYSGPVPVYENATVTAFAKKSNIYSSNEIKTIDNVDTISPVINTPQTGSTSFDLTVSGTSSDSGSGVKKITLYLKESTALVYDDTYTYETDIYDGVKDQTESYTHTFYGLNDGVNYTIKIVSEDYVGTTTEREVDVETNPYVARIVGMNGILWYTVDPDTKEIIIDDGKAFQYYGSIQEAINDCANIQCTIQTNPITPVVNESVKIADNQDITLDLDGREITSNQTATFVNNGKLQVVDRNPRETGEHEHDGIGSIKNTVGKAIINNGILTLGEGSSEASDPFIYPEMDRPIIEGKTNALENNRNFYFYDGKLVAEGQALSGNGEDAITQYLYNTILTVEDEKNVAILDRATDPEAKIRSTYYAKLKINNGPNAYDSSKSGTIDKESAKLLSRIKQYNDYGFVYDVVNDQIYNGNQTTANTTAISYLKLDLTDELNDQFLVFDTFADTYNSNSYGYISVSETLDNTGTQIYKTTGNDKVGNRIYQLVKGKVYYIYFVFVKGASDINPYETFKVTSLKLLGNRESTSDFNLQQDPNNYGFIKQNDGSYVSNNSGTDVTNTAHSYMIFDLTNETDDVSLTINYSTSSVRSRIRSYVYVSNDMNLQSESVTTGRYVYETSAVTDRTKTIILKHGEVNYVHFCHKNDWDTGSFTIHSIEFTKVKTEELIPTTAINHNETDSYFFERVDYDLNTWHDLSGNDNDATLYGMFFDNTNNGFNLYGNGYGIIPSPTYNLTNLEETVYVEYSTTSESSSIIYQGSSSERISIGKYGENLLVSNTWGGNSYFAKPSTYADGNKHSIQVSYNSGVYTLYYDGVELPRISGNQYFERTNTNTYIGRRDNGLVFSGKIYTIKVFNKEILPEELDNTENLVLNLDGSNSLVPSGTMSFVSNNNYVYNTAAHSYLTYDLTNIDEDKYLYINTMISSHTSDVGYVQVTDSPDFPSNTVGRSLSVSGDYDNKSVVVKLHKNQVNYVHFVYTKDRWDESGTDKFYIKEVKYCDTLQDAYSMNPSAYQNINTYYFDKPVLNTNVDTIELLKDVTLTTSIVVPQEQEVIIDLNGFKLSSEKEDYMIKNNGKLTIEDSELKERRNINIDYKTEQARLYNEARTQYLADKAEYEEYIGICDECTGPSAEYDLDQIITTDFDYTGSGETFTAPYAGTYSIKAWGAAGSTTALGGNGAYTEGKIDLSKNEQLYVYVGEQATSTQATFNGGGACSQYNNSTAGGGASDVRLINGNWNDSDSLASRIMVAAGGGGINPWSSGYYGGPGGTLTGIIGAGDSPTTPATQTTGGISSGNVTSKNGTFGIGGAGENWGGAGGGGYYGGAGGKNSSTGNGGGSGSSYISGYLGAVAVTDVNDLSPRLDSNNQVCTDQSALTDITCSYHYSGKKFTDGVMIAGNESMVSPVDGSTVTGNFGNGHVRIEVIESTEMDEARANLPKTYNVKTEPKYVDYLSGIDFDPFVDIDTLTPDSEVEYNNIISDDPGGGIITTIGHAILNEQYGTLRLDNIGINVNVNSKWGVTNRGNLILDKTEINANNSSTIGIFNESNGTITFNGGSINANGSASRGLLNRSITSTISGAKITTAQTNAIGLAEESLDDITYSNLNISGSGIGVNIFDAGDTTIIDSNIKSTDNYSVYNYAQSGPNKLVISNSNLYGQLLTNRTAKEVIVSNSTLTTVYNLMGTLTLNSSSLWSFENRGDTVINNSTFNTSGTAINNYAVPASETQYNSSMIINNSIVNSTATSAATVISNNDKMSVHNITVNNINGTKSTAFSNSSPSSYTAYLSIDGNSTIDPSFGTAINNTGVLTIGSDKSNIAEEYTYAYTGHQEEFVVPETGTYKLETWGASGAESPYGNSRSSFNHGGYGAYASGTIELQAGEKLYIHVGGAGYNGGHKNSYNVYDITAWLGSYNGGGPQTSTYGDAIGKSEYVGTGGGATDISRSNEDNTWSYDNGYVTNRRSASSYEQRIVVAGGGSGAGTYGGSANKDGGYSVDPSTSQLGYGSSAGGGGYYGGSSGVGGSSYVSDTLSNRVMLNGAEEMPDYDSSGYIKGNYGNGYAKITLLGTNADTVDSSPMISATNYGISGSGRVIYYDGTINATEALNTAIEDVPDNYDIYRSIDGNNHENIVLIPNSDVRPVPAGEEQYVAAIGNVKYTTIQNAVDAANNGDEIDLLVDINQQNMITIPDDKNLTIDFNGHTVTSYNQDALFHNANTSIDDTNVGTTITDSQNALNNNYWLGNNYFKNDGKLTIKNLQFYNKPTSNAVIVNNSKLKLDGVVIYFGYDLTNRAAVINNTTGNISTINCSFNVHNNYAWGAGDQVNNFANNYGTMEIKDSALNSLIGGNRDSYPGFYFLINNATGKYILDNITYTPSGSHTYYLLSNDGEVDLINNSNLNTRNITSTGIINLTNNTLTAGTISSTGLVRVNSGTYNNTFTINDGGKSIDNTDNLYSFILNDGTINTKLNINTSNISDIRGGTITVGSGIAVNNTAAGIINLGVKDGVVDTKTNTRPFINGQTYGIYTNSPGLVVNFYDGLVKAQTAYNVTIEDVETGYSIRRDYDEVNDIEEKYLTNEPMFTNVTQSVNYATVTELKNAIDNGLVNSNDVIAVYRNITITKNEPTITIPSGMNLTFDLNGKVVDKNNDLLFENNGTLTVQDSDSGNTGKIDSTLGNIVDNKNILNITSGEYVSQRDSKETAIIWNYENASLSITGGNYTKYYDKLDELNQQDRGFGSIINNSGDVTITGGHYTINSSHRGGYWNRVANYIYTSNVFWNTSTGVINASNITADGFASVDINADNKQYGSSISRPAEGQMFHNDGILNISNSTSTNSLIGDNTGTVVMEDVTMTNISYINNVWQSGMHKPIVNSGTFTIKGGDYTVAYQFAKNDGTLIITNDTLGTGTTVTRTSSNASCGFGCEREDNYNNRLIYNKSAGNVEINGATILCDSISTSTVVTNVSSGYIKVNNSILKTNDYPVISNESSGTIEITNNSELSSKTSVGVQNTSSGTLNIGKLKQDDRAVSQTYPLIVGNTYGVTNSASGTFNFYDGLLKGKTAARNGAITNIEPNYTIIEPDTPNDGYYEAYLDRIYVIENANDTTKKYYSIAEAFADAIGGEEFRMIANYSTTSDVATAENNRNNVVLDLNGFTISQGNGVLITNNGSLTIKDTSSNSTGIVNNITGTKTIENTGILNIIGGKITTSTNKLLVNNSAGATLTIKDNAKLESTGKSLLIDNSGTMNVLNGADIRTQRNNAIINRNILNVTDLNNDDDNNTSSLLTAPIIYSVNSGASLYEGQNEDASIYSTSGSTTTIYGGIYNNGETYASGSPSEGFIIKNEGTATIKNLDNYSFLIGGNNGTMTIENCHFYNFKNQAFINYGSGTALIKDTIIEKTTGTGLGTAYTRIINYGSLTFNNVTVTNRDTANGGSFIEAQGTVNIIDSNINFITNNANLMYGGATVNITNTTFNTNNSISSSGTVNFDNSTINSSGKAFEGSGTINIKNGTNVTATSNAIESTGRVNILDTSRVISTGGYGIYLTDNAVLNLGEIGGTPSVTDPYIKGSTYAIYNNSAVSEFNFYDGLLVGELGHNPIYGSLTYNESGYETTVTIDPDDNLNHEYLVVSATSVAIAQVGTYTFSSNGSISSSQTLQSAINYAIGDGTNVRTVELVANVSLIDDEVSLTAAYPVTVNLNGHTVDSNSTYSYSSNIHFGNGGAGGSISKLLSDTFGIINNPKDITIYELSDGSKLDVTKTYKLYKDGKVTKLEKEELGRYKYQGDNEDLIPIKGRLYIDNLGSGLYRLESSDNKYIEFSIDSDGNISGNVTENTKSSDSSSAVATSNAELILTIQTGIEKHYYLLFIIPIALITILLMTIVKNKKKEI